MSTMCMSAPTFVWLVLSISIFNFSAHASGLCSPRGQRQAARIETGGRCHVRLAREAAEPNGTNVALLPHPGEIKAKTLVDLEKPIRQRRWRIIWVGFDFKCVGIPDQLRPAHSHHTQASSLQWVSRQCRVCCACVWEEFALPLADQTRLLGRHSRFIGAETCLGVQSEGQNTLEGGGGGGGGAAAPAAAEACKVGTSARSPTSHTQNCRIH